MKPSGPSPWDAFYQQPRSLPTELRRVLVIDDMDSFRHFVSECLKPRGVVVKGTVKGEEGLELARVFQPDVIILDWVLKGNSGLDIARQLRNDEATKTIPTIMVSALREAGDARIAVQAGANLFLTKEQLNAVLVSYARSAGKAAPKGRILVIDDDAEVQEFIRRVLSPHGYELHFFSDGRAGLKELRTHTPDLVLLDLSLPGINGAEVFNILRADEALRRLPILVMTALSDSGGVTDTMLRTIHAENWLRKPFGDNELAARVARALLPRASTAQNASNATADLVMERGRIKVNVTRRKVWVEGREREVKGTRFDLLRILIAYDVPLSVERIYAEGWPGSQDPGSLRKAIQRLRDDLGLPDDPILNTRSGYHLLG